MRGYRRLWIALVIVIVASFTVLGAAGCRGLFARIGRNHFSSSQILDQRNNHHGNADRRIAQSAAAKSEFFESGIPQVMECIGTGYEIRCPMENVKSPTNQRMGSTSVLQ